MPSWMRPTMVWSSSARKKRDTRTLPVLSVMSNESTAEPYFAISRLLTAKTSPSSVTLPLSSVSSFMGVTSARFGMGLPMSTLALAFCSAFFCSGAGYSAWICTPRSRNCAASSCSIFVRSTGAGIRANHVCSSIVMLSRSMSTSSTSALSRPPQLSCRDAQSGNISRNGIFSLIASSLFA